MLSRTLKLLELDKVLEYLSSKAVTDPGRCRCVSIAPLEGKEAVQDASVLLREAMAWQGENGFSLSGFPDLEGVFTALGKPDTRLEIEAFWGLEQTFLSAGRAIQAAEKIDRTRFPAFHTFLSAYPWPEKLAAAVKRCLDDSGNLRDASSPELRQVRGEIRNLRDKCTKKVQDSLQDGYLSKYLQDEFLTISSDRYVLALKANFKGRVKGIVHDYSQTGETCYFEPMFLMELNNRLQGLKQKEKAEIERILQYLTSLAVQEQADLRGLYDWVVELDIILAKCALGRDMDAMALDMQEGESLSLKQARHPLLALRSGFVQPVDIVLDEGQRVLIISGGNSGGKTVALKTLGLCACMALCGLPVPVAEGSAIPFWSRIFVSIGDEQNLEENLSTFTAQIRHLREFWPQVGPSSLVILDEFGAGTSPSQGAALAQAVVDALTEKGVWVIVATHFPALKAYGLTRESARAASVLFDPQTKAPLYRLAYDQVGASQALEVAREQGLPGDILDRAREYLLVGGNEKEVFDRLNSLALKREKEIEDLKREREQLKAEYEKKLKDLEGERERLAEEIRGQSREILRSWKKGRAARKQALKELSELRQKAGPQKLKEREEDFSWDDLKTGSDCLYLPWDKKGVIQDKDEKKGLVKLDLGGVSMWVAPKDLRPLGSKEGESRDKTAGFLAPSRKAAPLRLDLRGLRVEEGIAELEKFLDQSLLSGRFHLEVVHGKGSGALRRAVAEYLSGMPQVKSYAPAPEDQGGAGVTLIELE